MTIDENRRFKCLIRNNEIPYQRAKIKIVNDEIYYLFTTNIILWIISCFLIIGLVVLLLTAKDPDFWRRLCSTKEIKGLRRTTMKIKPKAKKEKKVIAIQYQGDQLAFIATDEYDDLCRFFDDLMLDDINQDEYEALEKKYADITLSYRKSGYSSLIVILITIILIVILSILIPILSSIFIFL